MKNLIVLVLIFGVNCTFSQSIKGKVINEQKTPLIGVNVYFDGTTIGTVTDINGNFNFNNRSKLNSTLVVSYVGYSSKYLNSIEPDKELIITLLPLITALAEVKVQQSSFTRKQKMQLFKEQFLGRTPQGKKTIISNEDDLYFEYNKGTKSLKAFSEKPLQIYNSALGYKISYELVSFEAQFNKLSISSADVNKSYYSGLSRFEETKSSAKILKSREKSYEGSQLQFFRNLANNFWNKNNFLLFKGSFQVNPSEYFTISNSSDLKKVIVAKDEKANLKNQFVAVFNILYKKKLQSKIIFETNVFFIDKFGNNSNTESIYFSGAMSEQKVGDMLPLNYGMN